MPEEMKDIDKTGLNIVAIDKETNQATLIDLQNIPTVKRKENIFVRIFKKIFRKKQK